MRVVASQAYARFRGWWALRTEMQRDHLRLVAVLAGGIAVAGAAFWWGRPFLKSWQREQAFRQARAFREEHDYRSALLALHRAVEKEPTDLEAWKHVAEFLSEAGSPDALVARRNTVILAPNDLSLRLGFVVDALRFGDVAGAQEMTDSVRDGQREEVAFFRMVAAIAYTTRDQAGLEHALEALVQRMPEDREARFDLAAIRLWGADTERARAAEAEMHALLSFPDVRLRAAIELLKRAAQSGNREQARVLVADLCRVFLGQPPPELVSNTEPFGNPPGWTALLVALRQSGSSSANDAALLARWLGSIGQPREALVWLDTLSPTLRSARIVGSAKLDLAVMVDDPSRLRALLLDGAWGQTRPETIDLAFASRWQRRTGRLGNGQATWADAVASVSDSLPGLRVLARLAFAWGDAESAETALLAITDRFPSERWAWETLRLEYARNRATEKLWRLYDRWVRAQPADPTIAQDWAMLGLLTRQTSETIHAKARELFERQPAKIGARLVYAASLRAQNHRADALALLQAAPAADRDATRVKLWTGVLLQETKQRVDAQRVLADINPDLLLPEEAELWRSATAAAAKRT